MSKTKEVVKAKQELITILPVKRKVSLDALIRHETLKDVDIEKEENFGWNYAGTSPKLPHLFDLPN